MNISVRYYFYPYSDEFLVLDCVRGMHFTEDLCLFFEHINQYNEKLCPQRGCSGWPAQSYNFQYFKDSRSVGRSSMPRNYQICEIAKFTSSVSLKTYEVTIFDSYSIIEWIAPYLKGSEVPSRLMRLNNTHLNLISNYDVRHRVME